MTPSAHRTAMQVNRGLALALVTAMALLPTSARGAAAAVNVPPFASPPELAIFGPEVARAVSTTLSQSGVEITADGAPVAGRIEALGDERVRLVAGVAGRSAQVEGPLEEIDRLAVELSARLLQLVPPGSRRSGAGTARTATASAPAVTPRPASPAPTTASAPPSVPAAPPIAPPPPTLEERHGRHPAASVTLAPAKPGPAAAKPAASPAKPAPAVAQPAPAAVTPTKPAPAPVPTTPASPAPAAVAAHGASAAPEPAPAHPTSPAPASPPPPPPPATVAIASPPPDPGTPRTVRPAPPPPPVPSSATADPTYDTLPPPPPPPPVAQRPAPPSRSPSAYRALGRTLLRTVNTPDGCAAGLWATNAARDVLDHIHIQNQLGGCGFVSPPAAASAEAARAGASTVVMAQIERLRFDSVGGGRVLPVGQVRVAVVRDGRVVFLQLLQELSTHTIGTPDQRIAAYDLIATAFTRLAGPLQAVLTDPR